MVSLDESPIAVTEVQAQLPSMADAVRLLLGAAGLASWGARLLLRILVSDSVLLCGWHTKCR